MTDTEQFDVINTREWYTAMRIQAQTILGAMQTNGFSVSGNDAWIVTVVTGVLVEFQPVGQDVHARVGLKQDGSWMYDWHFPIGWVTT